MTVQANKQTDVKSQCQSWLGNKFLPFPFNNRGEVVVTPEKKFKIKGSGQEREVDEAELIKLAQQGDDYTKKTQALSEKEKAIQLKEQEQAGLKKIIDEMNTNPDLNTALNKVYADFKSGKISKPDVKDRNLKKLDKLIDDATDPSQRENLRDIREIIKEEADLGDVSSLRGEIKSLRDKLSQIENASLIGINDKIERDIKTLEEKFGKDLVDKYRNDIRSMATKYPQNSIPKIFKHFCDDDEYEQAILKEAKRKEKEELERKKRGSSPGGLETITAKTPLNKGVGGRVTHDSIIQRIKEKIGM